MMRYEDNKLIVPRLEIGRQLHGRRMVEHKFDNVGQSITTNGTPKSNQYYRTTEKVLLRSGQFIVIKSRIPSESVLVYAVFSLVDGSLVKAMYHTSNNYDTYHYCANDGEYIIACCANDGGDATMEIYDDNAVIATNIDFGVPEMCVLPYTRGEQTISTITYKMDKYISRMCFSFDFVAKSADVSVKFGNKEIAGGTHDVQCTISGNSVIIKIKQEASDTFDAADVILVQDTMPFTITSGESYHVEVKKSDMSSDDDNDTSGLSFNIYHDGKRYRKFFRKSNETINGVREAIASLAWGAPTISITAGRIEVYNLSIITDYGQKVRGMIFGDSVTEGDTMIDFGLDKRYSAMLQKEIGKDNFVIIAKGGESIRWGWYEMVLEYAELFSPKFIILAIGSNNLNAFTDDLTYIMRTIIRRLKNIGVTPILTTVKPRENIDLTPMIKINEFIKSQGCKYIDINKVLTSDADGLVLNKSLLLGDNKHPNVAGHKAIYDEIKATLPDLFGL